jgi:hypothetical protein
MMIPLRLYAYFAAVLVVLSAGWALHRHIDAGGYDRCRDEFALAAAQAEKKDHDDYLAAMAWGNQVSAQLAAAQQRIATLKDDHAEFAYSLAGTCPVSLRYLHDAAASGEDLSDAARASLASPATVDAGWIGSAVSANYARARECAAQLNALIDWHERTHRDQ